MTFASLLITFLIQFLFRHNVVQLLPFTVR